MFKKTASRSMAALIFVAGILWLAYLGSQPQHQWVHYSLQTGIDSESEPPIRRGKWKW